MEISRCRKGWGAYAPEAPPDIAAGTRACEASRREGAN